MDSYETQGTGYDSGASGHELQGRAAAPPKPPETPQEAFLRKVQEAPRVTVDVTRIEVCTGMAWLSDGSRISFRFSIPPVVQRVDGVLDQNGAPIYDVGWNNQVVVKPPKR